MVAPRSAALLVNACTCPQNRIRPPGFPLSSETNGCWMLEMTVRRKTSRDHDPSTLRLLQSVGLDDFDYFSPRKERAMNESLERWPLLRVVCDAMMIGRRGRRREADRFGTPTTVIDGSDEV